MAVNSRLMLIRHAPTHTTALVGWTDIEADVSDALAANWLQRRIPNDAIIVSSDLKRASATADAITGNRQRLSDSKALREIDFGDWEGKTADEVSQSHPTESRLFWSNPEKCCPPNGEPWNDLAERAGNFLSQMMVRFPERTIVAVSHFGTILSLASRAENARDFRLFQEPLKNWSLTNMCANGTTTRLLEFNSFP